MSEHCILAANRFARTFFAVIIIQTTCFDMVYLQGSVDHFVIGVQLMSQLVNEMNQVGFNLAGSTIGLPPPPSLTSHSHCDCHAGRE